ncbi:MAG: efflux RND transporter periplasmic adaptor subunit [candidate division WOR-3 bacterium]|nr:efflux RND transporter periplasmic adaptor subunit [candidate division WOR-3 bacterium]
MSIKTIAVILFVALVGASFFVLSFGEKAQKVELDKKLIGTKALCIVAGDSFVINESTPVIKYKDELYYMCCPGCDEQFIKNPEKYITNMSHEQMQKVETHSDSEVQYWTCTMHPEVRSDEEGACPICGMALIPVYERSDAGNMLHLDDRAIELAGISLAQVKRQHLHRELHLVGKVAFDPELVTAQEEYVNALHMSEMIGEGDAVAMERATRLIQGSEYKLKVLGMDDDEIRVLKRTRNIDRSLVLPDVASWVYADAYESDIAWIRRGQEAVVVSSALPGMELKGRVESISKILDSRKRSATIRIRLDRVEPVLTPGMFVEARINAPFRGNMADDPEMVLAVPAEAVLNSGTRQVVWAYLGDGKFQPRAVNLGPKTVAHVGDAPVHYYPVIEGLAENETIVINGNFLVDSESRLSGLAAIGYGGALGVEENERPPLGHQH